MKFKNYELEDRLGIEYIQHIIFEQLKFYSAFYDSLSFSIMGFIGKGTSGIVNIDTSTYLSMKGTIESIYDILKKGRINDAYALLRKYYDSTIINIYSNIYILDNYGDENFIIKRIDNWVKGIEQIPEYRIMSQYIKTSEKLRPINNLFEKDDRYKRIRERCNNNTHYNFYHNLLLNVSEICNPYRLKYLNTISYDMENLFIQHLGYIFYLNDYYMVSGDYMDSVDLGLQPHKDSQYWVAPFIQEVFDKVIKPKRADIANEIKSKTMMHLDRSYYNY